VLCTLCTDLLEIFVALGSDIFSILLMVGKNSYIFFGRYRRNIHAVPLPTGMFVELWVRLNLFIPSKHNFYQSPITTSLSGERFY
jgi:hypothetical protein